MNLARLVSFLRPETHFLPPPEKQHEWALARFAEAQRLLWQRRFRRATRALHDYRRAIVWEHFTRTDRRTNVAPRISVVIVAYRTGERLLRCIESLSGSPDVSHELIIVDNGGNESVADVLNQLPVCHILCPTNLLLSEGRNIGVEVARADIVCFVDDDAVVSEGYLRAVLQVFEKYSGVTGIRGRVLPLDSGYVESGIGHYDLGRYPLFSPVNTEGNSAFRRNSFLEVGGMDPLLFGHEGIDVSYRLACRYGLRTTIYWPDAIILHNYPSEDSDKRRQKDERHALMWDYLRWKTPGIKHYVKRMNRLMHEMPMSCQGSPA